MERDKLFQRMITTIPPQQIIKLKTQLPKDLLDFVHMIKKRLRLDWDIVIAITGEEGSGKSELTIWLGLLIDNRFDLLKNIAYLPSAKELEKKFHRLRRYAFFDVDEAAKSLHKYKWYDELQQTIVEMYATERFQNKATALLIPRFRDLTENFRNHRVKIWVNIINRDAKKGEAVAIAYIRDPDKDTKDPWHCDENARKKAKIFGKKRVTQRSVNEILNIERKLPNYLFDFKFPPLPANIRVIYDKLKTEFHKQKPKEEGKDKRGLIDKWKKVMQNFINYLLQQNKDMTQKEVALIGGISQVTISRLMKKEKK